MSNNTIKSTKNIEIIGAKLHNLKNISLNIPKDNLVVISGVSGSGKSSLALTHYMLKVKEDISKVYHLT